MNVVIVGRTTIGLLLLLAVTLTGAFKCPDQCDCTVVQRNNQLHNHVHCTDLEVLRALGKTSEINSLDLSALGLSKITNQLDKLSELNKLDLSNNNLIEINSLTNKHIRTLNLSHNRITTGKLLTIPVHVKHLDLSWNNITDIPLDFKRLLGLKSLELHGNPLNCTCETLEIRNWLQEKLVWTDSPITCSAPEQFKGGSWLQARQADVCEHRIDNEPRILPSSVTEASDDENDLMLGDDPSVLGDAIQTEDGTDDDELVKDFLPVTSRNNQKDEQSSGDFEMFIDAGNEGSGDDGTTTEGSTSDEPDLYEGSGDEVSEIVGARVLYNSESGVNHNHTEIEESDVDDDGSGISQYSHISQKRLDSSEEDLKNTTVIAVDAPHVHKLNESPSDPAKSENISLDPKKGDETKEGSSTYILLGILLVLLVVLILYVALKRNKKPAKRTVDDARSGARELLPIQKKPQIVGQNGSPEIVPLIGKNGKSNGNGNNNKGPTDLEGPLLQKLNGPEEGDVVESPPSEVKYENELPLTTAPATIAPASPNNDYKPVSPNPSRYSPVSNDFECFKFDVKKRLLESI